MGCSVPLLSKALVFPGFPLTKVSAFDSIFKQLESHYRLFSEIDAERTSATRRIERELGLTSTIKKAEAEDVVTAVLLCYSASCGGDLGQVEFSVSRERPFVHVKKEALSEVFKGIADEWERFITTIGDLEGRLRRSFEEVSRLTIDLRGKLYIAQFEQVEPILKSSKLTHSESLRVLSHVKQNMATSMDFLKLLRDAYRGMNCFQAYCNSLLEGYALEHKLRFVKEAGKCAYEGGVVDTRKLMEEFYIAGEDFVV